MTKQLQNAGIEVLKPAAFEPGLSGDFLGKALGETKRSGIR